MSRATASKSRADKNKTKDSDRAGTQSASVPPVSNDVVPGRFSESDWSHLIEREDGEDFIIDMVEEIVDQSLSVIYHNYIQKQLLPFTITKAKDDILQVIEWRFLERDEGEGEAVNKDVSWQEEEEPLPAVPDSWAQGSVPRTLIPVRTPTPSEHDTEVTSVSCLSRAGTINDDDDFTTFNETSADDLLVEEKAKPQVETIVEQQEETSPTLQQEVQEVPEKPTEQPVAFIPEPPKEQKKKKKFKYKPHRGPLKSAGLTRMNQTLDDAEREMNIAEIKSEMQQCDVEEIMAFDLLHMPSSCHSILKAQAGRPPGNKEVTYDEKGNVIAVMKMDPERLPSHRIKTQFSIVDPAVEAAHARLIAMRTGRYRVSQAKSKMTTRTTTTVGGDTIKTNAATTQSVLTLDSSSLPQHTTSFDQQAVTPLPPPLLDSMELAPGVVVKEGNRIRKGPRLRPRQEDVVTSATIKALRPLVHDGPGQRINVTAILGRQTPVLRPIPATEPVPPINPYSRIISN
ncbi:uncharacterized protein LOC100369816 [Saccoglossus kowalevskii]|uniref:Uncharacterized protein C2orf81 homolog n=1 Tax=Saccoglossus kowalevskii TaxID=10224 RepID=A0ABM0GQ74_SACKO|nr:PREDICTED: uncharacterized protein C2orf81 homolog [Saccoglossus kowalevskii]